MPVYEYRCPQGHTFERLLPIAQYREEQSCPCGFAAEKVILHPPKVFGDFAGYESPASGKWIEGRRARNEDFARTNTRPYEIGEARQSAAAAHKQSEAVLDARVDEAVERSINELTL